MTSFWLDNPKILLDNYLSFVPYRHQSRVEQLNSIARFCIYNIILLKAFNKDGLLMYGLIVVLGSTYFMNDKIKKESFVVENTCYAPTPENPFMNVLVNEYAENPERKEACEYDYPDVKEKIEEYYDNKMFRDVNDIYNTRNAFDRPYTNPATTIPNDRQKFVEYLYHDIIHGNQNCKNIDGTGDQCIQYTDLRHK